MGVRSSAQALLFLLSVVALLHLWRGVGLSGEADVLSELRQLSARLQKVEAAQTRWATSLEQSLKTVEERLQTYGGPHAGGPGGARVRPKPEQKRAPAPSEADSAQDVAPGSDEVKGAGTSMASLTALYREFSADLRALKHKVMTWANATDLHQGIFDVEAEIIYLRLRKLRPERVAELGFGQGLCTTYILQALEDNGRGHLYTYDLVDKFKREPLVEHQHRWTLTLGDARSTLEKNGPYAYVHSDCEHSVDFARWVGEWLARQSGVQFSFHDVYVPAPGSKAAKCTGAVWKGEGGPDNGITPEGAIILKVAAENAAYPPGEAFTVSPFSRKDAWAAVQRLRHSVGLDDNWVCDYRKYADATKLKKKNAHYHDQACQALQQEEPANPSVFFEV